MKEMDEKREIGKAEEAKSKKGEKEGEEEMNQEENQNCESLMGMEVISIIVHGYSAPWLKVATMLNPKLTFMFVGITAPSRKAFLQTAASCLSSKCVHWLSEPLWANIR